jgi:hypothetical protein
MGLSMVRNLAVVALVAFAFANLLATGAILTGAWRFDAKSNGAALRPFTSGDLKIVGPRKGGSGISPLLEAGPANICSDGGPHLSGGAPSVVFDRGAIGTWEAKRDLSLATASGL